MISESVTRAGGSLSLLERLHVCKANVSKDRREMDGMVCHHSNRIFGEAVVHSKHGLTII